MPRRKRRAYPSDLTNGQWALIEPMIPDAAPGGRPRRAAKREIVDAILYFPAGGMFVATAAARFSAMADDLLLPASMGARGCLD